MMSKKKLHESVSKLTTTITNGFEDLSRRLDLLIKAYSNLSDKQQKEIAALTDMLNNVINITFDGNKGFENVIFQRYGQAPIIYHKGKRIDVDDMTEVDITMIDGTSVIETTETHL